MKGYYIMRKTDKAIENQVIDLYLSGESFKSIENILHINSVTAYNIIKRNNIETRTRGGINLLPSEDIIRDYQSGIKIADIAQKYNVCEKTIYNYLSSNNIDRNYIYINRSLNRQYFKCIDSYDKAYFWGLLVTDGCICGNNVSITLKIEDSNILNTLSQKIGNENQLYFDKRGCATLHFKSKEIVNDLALCGVFPRKTFFPHMPILFYRYLMAHVIRGLIDGDGWISYKSHSIGFCSANFNMAQDVKNYLVWALGVYDVAVVATHTCYTIQWSSKKDIKLIGDFIYQDKKDCFIERKYNNFIQIITHDNTEITNQITQG